MSKMKEKPRRSYEARGVTARHKGGVRLTNNTYNFQPEFASRIRKLDDGCWEWTGWRDRDGYGSFWDKTLKRTLRAHRVACEAKHGPISKGLFACHTCDNPWCVNPDHLFIATNQENQLDSVAKGRRAHLMRESRLTGHCSRGHERTEANTGWSTTRSGRRQAFCRICAREQCREAYRAKHPLNEDSRPGRCKLGPRTFLVTSALGLEIVLTATSAHEARNTAYAQWKNSGLLPKGASNTITTKRYRNKDAI